MGEKHMFMQILKPLLGIFQELPLDAPETAQAVLSERAPVGGELLERVKVCAMDGLSEGWLVYKASGGMRHGMVRKDMDGFAIDAYVLQGDHAPALHEAGEINLCFSVDGQGAMDGCGEGWKVYPPGVSARPAVAGGEVLVLKFRPAT